MKHPKKKLWNKKLSPSNRYVTIEQWPTDTWYTTWEHYDLGVTFNQAMQRALRPERFDTKVVAFEHRPPEGFPF